MARKHFGRFSRRPYAILGVGNSDWVNTYHKVPKDVDELLSKKGAERLGSLGLANVAGDVFGAFEEWSDGLWNILSEGKDVRTNVPSLSVDYSKSEVQVMLGEKSTRLGTVRTNHQIAAAGKGAAKMHMVIELPVGNPSTTPASRHC